MPTTRKESPNHRPDQVMPSRVRITYATLAEWQAEGERRFGPDPMQWRFVCPMCGFVQTPADYKAAGASEGAVAFSCVGRWTGAKREAIGDNGKGPCNYAGGGLFRFNPVTIEGRENAVFAFAEATRWWKRKRKAKAVKCSEVGTE